MRSTYLCIMGLGFLLTGLAGLIVPQTLTDTAHITLSQVSSFSEIRSIYGGMHTVLGLFILNSVARKEWQYSALLFCTLFTGGYFTGRIISIFLDGMPSTAILIFTALELLGCLLGAFILKRSNSNSADA